MPDESSSSISPSAAPAGAERGQPTGARSSFQRMGRIIRTAVEEILGRAELDSILQRMFPSGAFSRDLLTLKPHTEAAADGMVTPAVNGLLRSLEAAYGARGGQGIALRIGQASFRQGLRVYGSTAGAQDIEFRLSPLPARVRAGLRSLARLFNEHAGQNIVVDEYGGNLLWRVENCPLCGEHRSTEPICYLAVGLLQEALCWLSGGRAFRVEEIACLSRGDSTCSFLIDQMPIS